MKKTRKCIECGAPTYYHNADGSDSDTCQNCTVIKKMLWLTVAAINRHVPITGGQRKLTITEYQIERVKKS
jgi:hypothetical protein